MHHGERIETAASAPPADRHDRDIRVLLHSWLLEKHAGQSETTIIHELPIPRPSARADIALINGRIGGYEIKGAADSLVRLSDQEKSFSSVFERMTLVVAARHLGKVVKAVPEWWEIIETNGAGFRVHRCGKMNPALNLENLLHVLTRPELIDLQGSLNVRQRRRNVPKDMIVTDILAINRPQKTRALIRTALKLRPTRPLS